MAVKTLRLGSGQDGVWGALFEADQAAANRTDGWTSAKLAAAQMAEFNAGTKVASGGFSAVTKPALFTTTTPFNALVEGPLLGTFANSAWTFTFALRCTVASAQRGRIRLRVFKSKNANGSAATELTGATQVGTTVAAALSTTADQISTVTWNPGTIIRLNNEYIFFVIAWEITTAGGSNSADVVFRTGQASAGTRVVTPDFVANSEFFGAVALPITVGIETDGIRIPASLYRAAVVADSPAAYWRLNETSGPAAPAVGGFTLSDSGTVPGVEGLLTSEPTTKGRGFIAPGSFISGGSQPFKYNTITWEVWVKRTRTNVSEILIDQYNGGYRVIINFDGALYLQHSYGNSIAHTVNLKILDTNAHHIVVTRAGIGGDVIFYVDGVAELGTPDTEYTFDVSGWPNYAIFIGSTWGSGGFDGTMDELAVYSTVLSPEQVTNHYRVGSPPPAVTYYGETSTIINFNAVIEGKRKAFGQVALPVTFSKDVSGQRKTFGKILSSFTFGKDVAGRKTTFGQTIFPITVGIVTSGVKLANTLYGAVSLPITFAKDVGGQRKTFGQVAALFTFSKDVRGQRKTFGQLLSPFIFGKAVTGNRTTFSQIAFPITAGIATAGVKVGKILYGSLTLPLTFVKDVKGVRKTFSQIAVPLAFTKDVKGVRKTFGQITFPIIFTKEAVGRKNVFGQLSMQTLFGKETAGRRQTFSQLTFPIVFSKVVAGNKKTFGQVALPINVAIVIGGTVRARQYGQLAMPLTFNKQIDARRITFGQVTAPFIFGVASQGQQRTFSQIVMPIDFIADVKTGSIGVHGKIVFPIVIDIETSGRVFTAGIILNRAKSIYLGTELVDAVYVDSELVWPPPS